MGNTDAANAMPRSAASLVFMMEYLQFTSHNTAVSRCALLIYSIIEMRILQTLLLAMTIASAPLAAQVPRTADGHPDLNGFWKGTKDTKPVGNIAKDLPGLKLPFTPAGE